MLNRIFFLVFLCVGVAFASDDIFTLADIKHNFSNHIYEIQKTLTALGLILATYFILIFFSKLLFKYSTKNLSEEDTSHRYFDIKKIQNIIFLLITFLIIIFVYTDDIGDGLTIFGVIGAGLTIVMKEMILNVVSWFVMMTGSSIRIGDRIYIDKGSKPIIGDVIDISLTKITMYENITNDAIAEHKKAGRVIFVPNHFIIFNDVYNYTHLTMKTIVDAVEFNLDFDSNIEKAEIIANQIAVDLSERYTEMGKRQYDKLKHIYTMRNMTSYPKIYFYPSSKGNGITMSIWYISPYRDVMRLKTELTKRVLMRFKQEDDLKLIYTGNSMFVKHSEGVKTIEKEELDRFL